MKNQMDMTNGPLGMKILRYAIPLMITGMLQQLFNAADVAVVGRFAGTAAMAAVGANAPIVTMVVNLFIGISIGSNVIIARSIGQNDQEQVSKTVHTSIMLALIGGLMVMALGELLTPLIMKVLEVPEDVYSLTVIYLRIYLLGMPIIFLYNFEAAILRGVGNTKTPLIALALSGILNVGLNVFFVTVFGMSSDGVAIATVLSNVVSAGILFVYLVKTDLPVKVVLSKLRIHSEILSEVLRIGVPSGMQSVCFSFANLIIQTAINSLGTVIMAASSAGYNMEIFVYYVMIAFGQSCTTFVGQNYGASKNDRCRRVMKLCILQSTVATGAAIFIILTFSRQFLGLFNTDPDVIAYGRIRLQLVFASYAFTYLQEILSGYLRGFGISLTPAICAVVGIAGVRILWIFTAFRKVSTFLVIMMAYPVSLSVTTIAILIVVLYLKPSRRYFIEMK